MEDCIVYLVWQLRDAKFEVRFTWPNLLWISWKHHEAEYLAKQNPIIQAMVPERPPPAPPGGGAAPQAPKKKKSGGAAQGQAQAQPTGPAPPSRPPLSFSEEISLITGAPPLAAFGSPIPAPMRRAAEYMPPNSFVQTMDRPMKEGAKGNVLADLWSV
jgi:hypothetical protein